MSILPKRLSPTNFRGPKRPSPTTTPRTENFSLPPVTPHDPFGPRTAVRLSPSGQPQLTKRKVRKRSTKKRSKQAQGPDPNKRNGGDFSSRLGYRAASGRVQLSVQQPFFNKTRNKLQKAHRQDRKRAMVIYRRRQYAAIMIQRAMRMPLARAEVERMRIWHAENWKAEQIRKEKLALKRELDRKKRRAAIELQRAARGKLARKEFTTRMQTEADRRAAAAEEKRLKRVREAERKAAERRRKKEKAAAIKLQSAERARSARQLVHKKKVDIQKNDAASCLQATVRGHQARKHAEVKAAAATTINSSFGRSVLARRQVAKRQQERQKERQKEEQAATQITKSVRGHLSRKQSAQLAQTHEATVTIQKVMRGHHTRRSTGHLLGDLQALEQAVARAEKNFDYEALRDFTATALAHGVSPTNSVVQRAERVYAHLVQKHQAALRLQRMVRGKLVRLELETLRMQVEAAVMLQSFMRLKMSQTRLRHLKAKANENKAVGRLQRAVRGMISRKIFAEGMQILNEKLSEAMETLSQMLAGPNGDALARQHLLIRNAKPSPQEQAVNQAAVEKGEKPLPLREPLIPDLAEALDIVVERPTPTDRLGGGFDKCVGMSSTTYKGLVARLVVTKVSSGSPMQACRVLQEDIILKIDKEWIESVQDLVGAVSGKTKMVFRVVRALREPTTAELAANLDVIRDEFRRHSERRIVNLQKKALVQELFGMASEAGAINELMVGRPRSGTDVTDATETSVEEDLDLLQREQAEDEKLARVRAEAQKVARLQAEARAKAEQARAKLEADREKQKQAQATGTGAGSQGPETPAASATSATANDKNNGQRSVAENELADAPGIGTQGDASREEQEGGDGADRMTSTESEEIPNPAKDELQIESPPNETSDMPIDSKSKQEVPARQAEPSGSDLQGLDGDIVDGDAEDSGAQSQSEGHVDGEETLEETDTKQQEQKEQEHAAAKPETQEKKSWRGLVKKRWREIKLLAMSLSVFKGEQDRVDIDLGDVERKTMPEGENVAEREVLETKLQNAVFDYNPESLKELLDSGPLPENVMETTDDSEYTLLLTCVSCADEENNEASLHIAKSLIEAKANVNHVGADGSTPLIMACYQNNPEMVDMLVDAAGDRLEFQKTIQNGATGLYLACQDGHTEVVETLLKRADCRALLSHPTDAGCTPLFIAVHVGYDDLVDVICSAVQEHDGPTALDDLFSASALDTDLLSMAVQRSRFDCAATLLHYGMHVDTSQTNSTLSAENQPMQVCVCIGAPTSLLHDLLETAVEAVEAIEDEAEQKKQRENLRSFAANAAKTAAFMLELDHLNELKQSGLINADDASPLGQVFTEVHKAPLSKMLEFHEKHDPETDSVTLKCVEEMDEEAQKLVAQGQEFVTSQDLSLLLTKAGYGKHYGDHFTEFRELVLFRMASLCYLNDEEEGLEDVGDAVEDNAVPIEGLKRVTEYLGVIKPYFSV